MKTQENISKARLKQKVGQTLTVLIDANDGKKAVARSSADAPEIDGNVLISKPGAIKPGDFVQVKVTRATAHDLHAAVL